MIKKQNFFLHHKKQIVFALILLAASIGSYLSYNWLWQDTQQTVLTQKAPTEIKGNIITLRRLKEEYFVDYHNMFSPVARKGLEFPESITLSYTIAYLHEEMRNAAKGKMLEYCIFDNKDNKLIGYLDIRDYDPTDVGQFGCWINENYWGGGRFKEAVDLISKAYFKLHPNEQKYIAYVRLWNKRSYHALKKCGFLETGYYYVDGQPGGHILEFKRP